MPRGLLVAVGLLLVLGGGIWYAEKHPKTDDTKKASNVTPKMLSVPEAQITELQITKAGSPPLVIAKLADKWQILTPKPIPADAEAVTAMTSPLSSLTGDRLIDGKPPSLTPYGLDKPVTQVEIKRKDGKADTLLFGADTPAGGNVYAKLANDPKVYTLASATKTSFDKTMVDLRDKRVLPFNSDKLTSVALTAKNQTVEFAKNGQSDWQITKLKPYRADNLQVDDLVRKLKDAKLDLAGGDASKAFASAAKLATAAVTDNSGTQTVEFRKSSDKSVYAKSSAVDGIYKVTGDVGDGLEKSVDDFRNKKLFDFGFSDPSKLELNGTVYERTGDKWKSAGKDIDGPSLQAVIDKLRDLSATKFGDKFEGSQISSINITYGDQKRVEKVSIHRAGDSAQAQREGEPTVYLLETKTADELQKAIAGIKPAQAASKSQKK